MDAYFLKYDGNCLWIFLLQNIIEIVNYPLLQYKKIKTSFLQMFY